jgi:hypothetical protein
VTNSSDCNTASCVQLLLFFSIVNRDESRQHDESYTAICIFIARYITPPHALLQRAQYMHNGMLQVRVLRGSSDLACAAWPYQEPLYM